MPRTAIKKNSSDDDDPPKLKAFNCAKFSLHGHRKRWTGFETAIT